MDNAQSSRPASAVARPLGRHTIFFRVLTGYVVMAIIVVALAGFVSALLIRRYVLETNLADLLDRAEAVAASLARADGRLRVLTPRGLREMESLCDAQLIYVGDDMVARQMPVRPRGWWLVPLPSPSPTPDAPSRPKRAKSLPTLYPALSNRMLALYGDLFRGAVIDPDRQAELARINLAGSVDEQLVRSIMNGEKATDVRHLQLLSYPVIFAGIPIADLEGGATSAALILCRPLTEVSRVTGQILTMFSLSGAAALACAAALAWFMSRRMTRPIMALSAIAARMADGHYGERIALGTRDEIGQLGDTLNTLSARLEEDASAAQKLEQLRRDYIANISHEPRTPLTGIRGMVEPLLDGMMETEAERESCYRIIYQETVRLEKMIAEMLDMSRLQSGRADLALEPMPIAGLLEAAARRMRSRADEAGIALDVDAPGDQLAVMGDEDRILQVLIILMDNALSFTPPGGRVTLAGRRAGKGAVAISVADTGAGIDPADLPYIWERFYKADRSRMRTSGTGLGLSIAKMVVELMGGEIGVETAPGEGSTFTFTLKEAIQLP
ncbi:MAG: ATP-binding protein [Christensenellaceae bacterium]|nr:ATP-binding protein [Christensenellaceae bacterium]